MRSELSRAARRARAVVLLLVVLLCGWFVLWHLARFSRGTALLAGAAGVLPWLLLAGGLVRGRPQACLAALLLTTPYLGYGLMEVLANPGARAYAATLVFLSFALAVAAIACLRLTRRRAPAPT
jgi:uncharacterized membrane protein